MRFSSLLVATVLTFSFITACSSDATTPSRTSSSSGSSSSGEVAEASFKDDVVPILALNCALAACHAAKESNLGIHLTYVKDQLYTELQKSSPTAGFNKAKFVVPGKPEESLLMAKMDGTQAKLSQCKTGCGNEMPPGELIKIEDRNVIRTWIKRGAKDD